MNDEIVKIREKTKDMQVTKEYIEDVHVHTLRNEKVSRYLMLMSQDATAPKEKAELKKLSKRVGSCHTRWYIEEYVNSQIKDLKKTWMCGFFLGCNNCKKIWQAIKTLQYEPLLYEYRENLYHLTLTVPNVKAEDLKDAIKNMKNALSKFIKYLSISKQKKLRGLSENKGKRENILYSYTDDDSYKKILTKLKGFKGVYLEDFNYKGALCSLEVTWFYDHDGILWFHPHFHCGLVLEDFQEGSKFHENSFTYNCNKPDEKTLFSIHEDLIQRLWYLCYNTERFKDKKVTVTLKNIENIRDIRRKFGDKRKTEGYSCVLKKFKNNNYAELFKYMIKEVGKKDDKTEVMNRYIFETLFYALRNESQLRGYGVFRSINDDIVVTNQKEKMNLIHNGYKKLIDELNSVDVKENKVMSIEKIRVDMIKNNLSIYISKKKYFSYIIQELIKDIKSEVVEDHVLYITDNLKVEGKVNEVNQYFYEMAYETCKQIEYENKNKKHKEKRVYL